MENPTRYMAIIDKYEISDHGELFSNNYNRSGKRRQLKLQKDKDGYFITSMCIDGKVRGCKVHRLVAEAFVPNPHGYKEVNHEDGNKTNNHFSNLKWCTRLYNIVHSLETGLKPKSTKRQREAVATSNKLKRKPIFQYTEQKEFVGNYSSLTEAGEKTKVDISNISACCLGKIKSAGGFIWSY